VEDFMQTYGIHHRVFSVANPHANTRAELGVKTVKRLLRENVTIHGKLESAKFSRALLQYRNTPDRDTKMSPAMALFGRELRDFLPRPGMALMGDMWTGLALKHWQDGPQMQERNGHSQPNCWVWETQSSFRTSWEITVASGIRGVPW
jgi:hypothetical protein